MSIGGLVQRCADHKWRRKVRWRSSVPLRGPLPLTRPRTAMPFDGTCGPRSLRDVYHKQQTWWRQEARTRPLRCFAIRVLSSDSCRLRNVIVDIDCRRGGYHRPGPGCRRKVRWRSSSPLSWVPSHKAADGHAFRSSPGTRALRSTDTNANKWCK